MNEIKNRINEKVCYGICTYEPGFITNDFTEETVFTTIAGVEVSEISSIPEGMTSRIMPTQKYAVFVHKGSLDNLRHTYEFIYNTWAAKSEFEIAEADDFELYDERFNPMDDENSEIDIYVPIK